jgi:hypothetical protein
VPELQREKRVEFERAPIKWYIDQHCNGGREIQWREIYNVKSKVRFSKRIMRCIKIDLRAMGDFSEKGEAVLNNDV